MLSIIIPAHNEEEYLENCLKSIRDQTFKWYEIIVVCDCCTDKTRNIAKKYTKKVYTIKKQNVSAARNHGALKARENILVFLDADSVIAPNLLEEINKTIKQGCIGGVTKTKSFEKLWRSDLMWAIGNFFRHFFLAASGMIFCKANFFSGFDESKHLAEDTDLIIRLKKKGKMKYITNSYIKTSSRRFKKEGYCWTIYRQFSAFFTGTKEMYEDK